MGKHLLHLPSGDGAEIFLTTSICTNTPLIPDNATLRLLSAVHVTQIPLHIITTAQYNVTTCNAAVESYFSSVLLSPSHGEWWQRAQPESPLGILAAVEAGDQGIRDAPRITEVLFVASRIQSAPSTRLPSPPASSPTDGITSASTSSLVVRAIGLSSDLLHPADKPTSPLSPVADRESDVFGATFLPHQYFKLEEVIHEPPIKKRRTANDAFNEATERRKAARRKGGEGVSAAAASNAHRRSISGGQVSIPVQTRPLSRSPSIASSRPPTAVDGKRKSTLSRVESISALPSPTLDPAAPALLDKNKTLVQRAVMTCMRAYGLQQSDSKQRRKSLAMGTASPTLDTFLTATTDDHAKDEEYKLLYHQVYKGVCFAFRAHTSTVPLQVHAAAVAETADKLLAIFLADPIKEGLPGGDEKLTPGGRKLFGSAKVEKEPPFGVGVLG